MLSYRLHYNLNFQTPYKKIPLVSLLQLSDDEWDMCPFLPNSPPVN